MIKSSFPTLLILTPTLATSKYLDQTTSGIQRLTCNYIHLFIAPRDKVDSLKIRFPKSLVIEDQGKEKGLYGALNAGLLAAKSLEWDFFTYINDDDLFDDDLSKMLADHMVSKNQETVGFGFINNIDEHGKSIGGMAVSPFPSQYPALLKMGISPTGQQGMVFGRKVVDAVGFYDTKYRICADLDYWCRAMAAGFSFKLYPLKVGKFRIQKGQISSDIEVTIRELQQVTCASFPKSSSLFEKLFAFLCFRIYNIPRYFDRILHVGFKKSYDLFKC